MHFSLIVDEENAQFVLTFWMVDGTHVIYLYFELLFSVVWPNYVIPQIFS